MATSRSVVLVVEDEEESRDALREILELEGYEVATAANGRAALDALAALGDSVCLMLLDLAMPVMDGWQVVDHLRQDGRLGGVKVVITTSNGHRAPPGLPVFQKPLDVAKVMKTVESLC